MSVSKLIRVEKMTELCETLQAAFATQNSTGSEQTVAVNSMYHSCGRRVNRHSGPTRSSSCRLGAGKHDSSSLHSDQMADTDSQGQEYTPAEVQDMCKAICKVITPVPTSASPL